MAISRDVLVHARLDAALLDAWVAEGWIVQREEDGFTELDLARACLIRDLREDLGINDPGVEVVLDLLDQLHGLRAALRQLSGAVQGLPEPLRRETLAALRGAAREA
jgi:chaperone modulatory protein CbpM